MAVAKCLKHVVVAFTFCVHCCAQKCHPKGSGSTLCGPEAAPDDLGLLQLNGGGVRAAPTGMLASDSQGAAGYVPDSTKKLRLEDLGPWRKLLGTWTGTKGYNIVSLPRSPARSGEATVHQFVPEAKNYVETITFSPIEEPILNRGYEDANQVDPAGMENQTFVGLHYSQTIHHLLDDGSTSELLHFENGQWLLNYVPGIDESWKVARLASIPHGNNVMALGGKPEKQVWNQTRDVMSELKQSQGQMVPPNEFVGSALTYGDMFYNTEFTLITVVPDSDPVQRLINNLPPNNNFTSHMVNFTTTWPGGSLISLPNVKAQVFPEALNATFWLEEWDDEAGERQMQLQYFQVLFLDFLNTFSEECRGPPPPHPTSLLEQAGPTAQASSKCRIKWPHISVNTLTKVKDYDAMAPTS